MPDITRNGVAKILLAALLAGFFLAGVFLCYPDLDLWFSALFTDASGGFVANQSNGLATLRSFLWNACNLLVLFSIIMLIFSGLAKPAMLISRRVWLFVVAAYLLGPGVLANGIFKANWGRARPQSVTEFGGTQDFTPPLWIADQCVSNCSFISGEASGITTIAVVLTILFWNTSGRKARSWILTAAVLVAGFGSLMRVMKGRHFLSDILFAADFMIILICLLFIALGLHRYLADVTLRAVLSDLGNILAVLKNGMLRIIRR